MALATCSSLHRGEPIGDNLPTESGAVIAISHAVRPILPRVAVRAERALSGRAEGKCKHVGGFYFRRSTHGESFGIAK